MLLSDDVIQEIHKFPFPIQKLLGDEALAVNGRLEQGKAPPNLFAAECDCQFFARYLPYLSSTYVWTDQDLDREHVAFFPDHVRGKWI
jgi:hypothetical protein